MSTKTTVLLYFLKIVSRWITQDFITLEIQIQSFRQVQFLKWLLRNNNQKNKSPPAGTCSSPLTSNSAKPTQTNWMKSNWESSMKSTKSSSIAKRCWCMTTKRRTWAKTKRLPPRETAWSTFSAKHAAWRSASRRSDTWSSTRWSKCFLLFIIY